MSLFCIEYWCKVPFFFPHMVVACCSYPSIELARTDFIQTRQPCPYITIDPLLLAATVVHTKVK